MVYQLCPNWNPREPRMTLNADKTLWRYLSWFNFYATQLGNSVHFLRWPHWVSVSRGGNNCEALVRHRAGRGTELVCVPIILQHQHPPSMPAPSLSSQAIRSSLREARRTFSGHFPAFGILPRESTGEELRKGREWSKGSSYQLPGESWASGISSHLFLSLPPQAVPKLRTLQGGGRLLHLLSPHLVLNPGSLLLLTPQPDD